MSGAANGDHTIGERIREDMHRFTTTERKAAHVLLANYPVAVSKRWRNSPGARPSAHPPCCASSDASAFRAIRTSSARCATNSTSRVSRP